MELTKEYKEQFLDLACQLSPENLCCDGELPKYLVKQKYAKLMKQWKALEKKVGRPVSELEVY